MKIYLDNCCLNRPFDDQLQDKIRLESEAILGIIYKCEQGIWEFYQSDVLSIEISRMIDIMKKQKVLLIYDSAVLYVKINNEIKDRAVELAQYGIKPFDALHLASAEYDRADVFLTTDIKLVKMSTEINIKIRVENPIIWYMEVLSNETCD